MQIFFTFSERPTLILFLVNEFARFGISMKVEKSWSVARLNFSRTSIWEYAEVKVCYSVLIVWISCELPTFIVCFGNGLFIKATRTTTSPYELVVPSWAGTTVRKLCSRLKLITEIPQFLRPYVFLPY